MGDSGKRNTKKAVDLLKGLYPTKYDSNLIEGGEDYIRKAVEILKEDKLTTIPLERNSHLKDSDVLIDLIMEEIIIEKKGINPHKLKISGQYLERQIHDILDSIKHETGPVTLFHKKLNEKIKEIKNKQKNNFTIVFPLNITGSKLPLKFSINDTEIKKLEKENGIENTGKIAIRLRDNLTELLFSDINNTKFLDKYLKNSYFRYKHVFLNCLY